MLPLGLSFALCARVGHHLGAAQPHSAKLAAKVGTGMGIAATALPALLIILLGSRTATLFTDDAAVIHACAPLILPLATVMITNSATALLGGILRGSGRQKVGAIVNGAANYGLGLPLQLLFAFKWGAGVAGLWWGIAVAATLQALVLAVLVSRQPRDDLLLEIFDQLDDTERRIVCLVCRHWSYLADEPTMLAGLAVSCEGPDWAQRYLEFAAWLPLRARHVRQLSVRAMCAPDDIPSDEEEACTYDATLGLLAACAAARQLTSLSLQLGSSFQQGFWLPALRTLRRLKIDTLREAVLNASLASLTGLEELEVGGYPTLTVLLHIRPRPLAAGLEIAVYTGHAEDEECNSAYLGRQGILFAVPRTQAGLERFASNLVDGASEGFGQDGPGTLALPAKHDKWYRGWCRVQLDMLLPEEVQASLKVRWEP
ncbi:TRANSPARENT TESTA 12-like [Chlorella sorokiniana]|uniref:TRANSPARENT TESTA 12-like n=1 Tax=Chlorella sorokiniana TaxID=3076 RepID=A0A2P6TLD1_CHLSO|nr:TRANSPARENT TESTA 12-like [Chlorella sorokiniana]|eukprot:PRW45075.1 TRANSPARENT TESTA 12-like [Chlorella sorokiniana]